MTGTKSIRCLVVAGVLLATLASRADTPATKPEPEEITFWFFASGTMGLEFQKIALGFNEIQDRYRVKPMMVPWNSNQKLMSSLAAGLPPDVMMVDRPAGPGWIIRGALEDITSFVEREGWTDEQFFSSAWRDGMYKDRNYVIPLRSDIRCLIYNRDLFRKAGLDPDRPPKTWDELIEYARKLTVKDARGRVRQLGYYGDHTTVLVMGWQKGADLASEDLTRITMNDPAFVEAAEVYRQIVDISGIDAFLRIATSGSPLEASDPFFNGRIGMQLVEGFYLTRLKESAPNVDAALAPFPMPTDAPPVSWISGFGLGIPYGARNREGAWAFIKYLVSMEPQVAVGERLGQLPVLRAAAYDPRVYNDPNRRFLIDMTDRCRFYPKVPVIMEAYGELLKAVDEVRYGKSSPQQALDKATVNVQQSLDRYLWQESLPLLPWRYFVVPVLVVSALVLAGLLAAAVRYGRKGPQRRNELLAGYGFVSPWLFGLVVLTLGPMVVSLIYSLCEYQVLTPARWAGLSNYRRMFTDDPLFWKSLWNTVYYTIFSVPLAMALALALALLLNEPLKGMRIFRTIFYVPTLVTGVAVGVLWLWLLQPEQGLVNTALGWIGIKGPLWFQSEVWSKPSLIFMSLWGVGGSVLIFLAGLQGIPRELYEAAEIDGAGRWRRFLNVTIPLLTPTIFFVLVVGIIGSFQVFTQAYVVSAGQGGPLDSTLFFVFYLYRKGFEDFQMGYASAMAWVLFAVIFALTLVQLRLSRRWVHY